MTGNPVAATIFLTLALFACGDGEQSAAFTSCTAPSAYMPVDAQHWTASSRTAMAITGDILFARDQIRFADGQTAKLRHMGNIAKAPADEAGTFFDIECVALYAVEPAFTGTLLNGNTICPQLLYIAAGTSAPDGLGLAAYGSGTDPILLSSVTGSLCGTFNYFQQTGEATPPSSR